MKTPNVVVVVFDTARWDRFGCYGYRRATTPTVDSLAAKGLKVDTMMANAPWTPPSHASLFTGLYPSQHGCQWGNEIRLRDSVPLTMAEWFRDSGYETVCATNNGLISNETRLARGFERYAFRLDLEKGRRRLARRAQKALFGGDSGGRIMNSWLEHELPRVKKPMFLFVNYLECHWAYAPPRKFVRRVGGAKFRPGEGLHYRLRIADRMGPWEAIARADERTLNIYSALYDAELANADNHLARLLRILERSGHLEDSIVLVTSDHGEHIGEHGLADHHASLDDVVARVPFVAWGPGVIPRGERGGVWELVDVFPSLVQLLGRELPTPYLRQRRSDMFAETPKEAGSAVSEWRRWNEKEMSRLARRNPSFDFSGLGRDLLSVRNERYKLVQGSDGFRSLFDLEADPDETHDVASAYPDLVARFSDELQSALEDWSPWDRDEMGLTEDESRTIEEHLSALGYI